MENKYNSTVHFNILTMKYNRRSFIKRLGLLYGSLLLIPSCNRTISPIDEHIECLNALCNQIIPEDEFPGAVSAGATSFIKKQLDLHLDYCKDAYVKGLNALQNYCKKNFGKKFEMLSSFAQIQLMQEMEKGQLKGNEWKEISSNVFFALILKHTMMSFYGSPRHGGNKGYISYKMLRLDVPLVIGQNRY